MQDFAEKYSGFSENTLLEKNTTIYLYRPLGPMNTGIGDRYMFDNIYLTYTSPGTLRVLATKTTILRATG